MTSSTPTPPAPGRAEAVSDEQLDALEEMAATVAVKGPLLRELIAEVRASRRATSAIVAEVGEARRWIHRAVKGWEEAPPGDQGDWVSSSAYDAALRTLAEVRGQLREVIAEAAVRNDEVTGLAGMLQEATQRAEQAEAECRRVKQEHNDYIANTVQKLHAKVFSLEQDRDHWKEQAQPVVSLKEGLVSELIERCMRAEAGRDAAIETLKLAREFIRKPDLTTSRDFAQEELWDKLQAALALPAQATNATGSSHEKESVK